MARILIFALFALAQVYGQDEEAVVEEQRPLIQVDVYYESLCPDSMNFINRQLVPSYPGLKDYIHVNLVPFGKASWTDGEGSRPAQFSCQHGPNECRGNQAHSCALHEIAQTYQNPEDQQVKSVNVIGCVMASGGSATLVSSCAQKYNIARNVISRISSCANSNEGRNLLVENGKRTFAFQNPLKFVPTIVINGEKNDDAFNNFTKAICDEIPAGEKPNACSK